MGCEHSHEESNSTNYSSTRYCELHNLAKTIIVLRSIVITGYRLHSLVHAHCHDNKDETYSVCYAIRTNSKVTSMLHQTGVDKNHHETTTCIHRKWRNTDTYDILHNRLVKSEKTIVEMQKLLLVGEQFPLPGKRKELREYRCKSSSPDSQIQAIDEDWIENRIDHNRENRGIHSMTRLTGRAKNGIQTEIQMREDITAKYYLHIIPSVWEGIVRSPKEP